jgi:hypothetical protein
LYKNNIENVLTIGIKIILKKYLQICIEKLLQNSTYCCLRFKVKNGS